MYKKTHIRMYLNPHVKKNSLYIILLLYDFIIVLYYYIIILIYSYIMIFLYYYILILLYYYIIILLYYLNPLYQFCYENLTNSKASHSPAEAAGAAG